MSSTTHITCPNCGHAIDIEELLAHDIEDRVQREQQEHFNAERERLQVEVAERVRRESEAQILALQHENEERKRDVQALKSAEVQLLDLQRKMREQQESFDLTLQKRLLEEQTSMETKIRKTEAERFEVERKREQERFDLERREMQKKLDDTQKAMEEVRRKSEQSSQQLQGEVQELAIEDFLRQRFPHDEVSEVGKGQRGADCIQTVYDSGRRCGQITYESKRTKNFSMEWVEKLKSDMRAKGSDIGVIITETMPKELQSFGSVNGIWVCTYAEFKSLCVVLRDMVIRVSSAIVSQENKGDKMTMLYDYLMSSEFRMSVENVMEAYEHMRSDLDRERTSMEKLWKQRERQIERMRLSMSHVMGSIQGIAGKDLGPVRSFELPVADDTPVD
ncbi:MAG: DUF2130 domain-containing protein [Ignavibacteria bacterium]|nr:DUF2130 domain-containing protein [Ignavibacteria bacterium]MBP6509551.1 DUF2130 domain-containing protein [Candidatus Kapabacteria bacterium]MBK6420155.1 DUF2130 domain-containing protein [Ignavibacteria bacterium]MBK6759209.1 DUF2130 domain-containing protein [Ignavibacteria bacterium]MBK7034352.1 DUF2130 domain-containing protein [Ignavibacteria bacterium]